MNESEPKSLSRRKTEVVAALAIFGLAVLACLGLRGCQPSYDQSASSVPKPAFPTQPFFLPLLENYAVLPPKFTPETTPSPGSGESCIYSSPWINRMATPVPDGGHSAFQKWSCHDGYWYIGRWDLINSAGGWGQDGTPEDFFIQFHPDGTIADRMFFNLQGTRIPGPTK